MKLSAHAEPLFVLGRRFAAMPWLKTFGISGFMGLFFVGYFYILNHAFFAVTVMPLTVVDRLIPYQTAGWLLYISLWVYATFPSALSRNFRELLGHGVTAAVVSLAGFFFFIFWPTAVPSEQLAGGSAFERIRSLDTTGNSCPSLHVAFSVLTAILLDRTLAGLPHARWLRWVNVLWAAGIVYSTLDTKQHVSLDALAGIALGALGAWFHFRVVARRAAPASAPAFTADQSSPAARKL